MSKRKKRTQGRGTRPDTDAAKRSNSWFVRWIPASIRTDPFFSLEVFVFTTLARWILLPVAILIGVIFIFMLLFGADL